jgi:hypothetical protein
MIRVRPRRRKGRPSTQPRQTRTLMSPLFTWLKLDQKMASFRAMKAFWDAVSPRIRAHARGERLLGTTLYVRVESAAWSHELGVLKPALLDKLKKTPGGEEVQDLRFSVGPLSEVPDWSGRTSGAQQELLDVPESIPDEIQRALEGVTDPEMREQLTRMVKRVGVRRSRT